MLRTAVVVHSGGMDSSLCLAYALHCHGRGNVLSLSFDYGQRNRRELMHAQQICDDWQVTHETIAIHAVAQLTDNALVNHQLALTYEPDKQQPPNTLVIGRNGLWARLAAMRAHQLGADCIYMGVMAAEGANPGYRDCSREYMNLVERVLRIDLDYPHFEIRTPLVDLNKMQSLEWAHQLGVLYYLLDQTISCYEGLPHWGCRQCVACVLRNQGLVEFMRRYPHVELPAAYDQNCVNVSVR